MNGLLEATSICDTGILANLCEPAESRTEVGLARLMQHTLVPPVAYKDSRVEAYGHTIPREQLGGDLLDLVSTGRETTAYVADVSGHGFRAGVLMGMVKTAMRYGLLLGQSLPSLLDAVNRVLPAVKESHMYATLAALRFDGSSKAEYITAGHLPLLHYRHRHADVVPHPLAQLPLGLFDTPGYRSTLVHYAPGDVFALMTDGIVETTDDHDFQFGSAPVEQILRSRAECPLSEIYQEALTAVGHFGTQQDDRTLLLVRVLA
jgi:serine phosphatase RsbU (regulator of sigma subunit)